MPRKLRVLVIDDEPDTVVTLLAILRDEGFEVKGFGSARAALQEIADFDPDVVISDLAMPSLSGWELAREVRKQGGPGARPILIAISGKYTKPPDKLLSKVAGFNHHLTKPCDPQALIALIAPLAPSTQ